ncbi:MAG: choice-of-anchor B family protein [Saprospiraceae bacterium]
MKKLLFVIGMCLTLNMGWAQLNMSLMSHIEYGVDLNDIWGYVAPDGTEYALVGAYDGVSIVSLADPTDAVEVAFVPGQGSIWRDIKTWGTYAYVVTDQGGTTEGLTVINLADLPNSVDYFHWTPQLQGLGTLNRCHNIYIDEFGYAYLAGCNINGGGMIFIDVFSTPGTPVFAGAGAPVYAHDVYTRDNKMYASELNLGRMGVYDVSNKQAPVLLGSQLTPREFTHNIWLSDDGNVAFTTDELPDAPIAAYDVSDPSDIQELDQYRPAATLGSSVIPHNVHVWNDWLVISYYTDGGIVVDASRPDNLIEVGNFDTFFAPGAGFNGVWGAYPFLPSGVVLLSDINSGLYVLDVNYVRGCYLEVSHGCGIWRCVECGSCCYRSRRG